MADFKSTVIVQYPRVGKTVTADTLYWKKLSFPVAVKDFGPINYIDFSPAEPHFFAVTCSSRVQVYSPLSNEVCYSLSQFKSSAFGGSFREDGKLLVAGSEDGISRLFDVKSKNALRMFKGHKASIHRCCFTKDGTHVITFSDDKSVGLWDIPKEERTFSMQGHQDYIRAGAASKASQDIFISGSYDHSVKMYDTRTSTTVLSVDHGSPVESVLMFPSGSVFISAGGTSVKVWDAAAGGRLLAQVTQHHKTVTCLCFASGNRRLMSGSLDRHVKIYDTQTYQMVSTLDYPSPILSLSIAPEDKTVVCGMVDGLISIRHRRALSEKGKREEKERQRKRNRIFYHYQQPDVDIHQKEGDFYIAHEGKKKVTPYDKYLRTFQSSRALDAALSNHFQMKKPQVTISVIQELIRRSALKGAIAGRDGKTLSPLVKFVTRYIGDARFMRVLTDVASIIVDIYGPKLGESEELQQQLRYVNQVLQREVEHMAVMMELRGATETILAVASAGSSQIPVHNLIEEPSMSVAHL